MPSSIFEDVSFDAADFRADPDGGGAHGYWTVSEENVRYFRWERTGDVATVQLSLDQGSTISGSTSGPPHLYVKLPGDLRASDRYETTFAYTEHQWAETYSTDGHLIVFRDDNPPATSYIRLGKLPGTPFDNGTYLGLFFEARIPLMPEE